MKKETLEPEHFTTEGERLLDAPLFIFDLPTVIDRLKNESTWKHAGHNAITLLKSPHMRIVLIAMHDGAEMKSRDTDSSISLEIIEGKAELETGGKTVSIKSGQLITLKENKSYNILAFDETVLLLTLAS